VEGIVERHGQPMRIAAAYTLDRSRNPVRTVPKAYLGEVWDNLSISAAGCERMRLGKPIEPRFHGATVIYPTT
jgi:hypothetical protein